MSGVRVSGSTAPARPVDKPQAKAGLNWVGLSWPCFCTKTPWHVVCWYGRRAENGSKAESTLYSCMLQSAQF